jgi:hypothetical protein
VLQAHHLDELVALGTLPAQVVRFPESAIASGLNLLVSRGPQAGAPLRVKRPRSRGSTSGLLLRACWRGGWGVMKSFEVDGQWWLPEAPDTKISGRLSVSEQGRAELSLIGALQPFLIGGDRDENGMYPRIVGVAGGKAYTLEDSFQIHRSTPFMGGLDAQRILVNQVFRGAHFAHDEPLEFHAVHVTMDWLAYWVMRSGFGEEREFGRLSDRREGTAIATLELKRIASESCRGEDGSTVTLWQAYGVDGDRIVERRLTQNFYFSIVRPELVDPRVLVDQVSDLQDLVSIGTGKVAAFGSLDLRHPDAVWPPDEKDSHEMAIEMFASWHVVNEEAPKLLHHFQMFFTLDDLGGMSGVERWLTVARRHRSALGRVMHTRYSKSMFISDRLFNCAAATEAYDREKHEDDATFAARVRRCASHAGEAFVDLVEDVDVWVSALKDARNDLAHHKPGMAAGKAERWFLSDSAYWLFVLCLLRDAEAPEAVFGRIVEHQDYLFLQRRLQQALATGEARRS